MVLSFVLGDTGGFGPQGYGQVCVCYSSEEKQWKTTQGDAGLGKHWSCSLIVEVQTLIMFTCRRGSNIDHVYLS